jgi:hypothetical protein
MKQQFGGISIFKEFRYLGSLYTSGLQPGLRIPAGVRQDYTHLQDAAINTKCSMYIQEQKAFWRKVVVGNKVRNLFFNEFCKSHAFRDNLNITLSCPLDASDVSVTEPSYRPPLWSSGQSSWLQIQRSGFDFRRYQIFWEVMGLERDALSLVSTTEELLGWKSGGSGLENREYGWRDPPRWLRDTLYPQKLALTSKSGGRSVGVVRSRAQATEFSCLEPSYGFSIMVPF